jgi:hypothetical protein
MNKYQKIALLAGAIILLLILGQTIYKAGFAAMKGLIRLPLKIIIVVIATLLIISFLKKVGKRK